MAGVEMLLEEDQAVQAWYLRPDGSNHDIAKAAYEAAVDQLKRKFVGDPEALDWIEGHKSLDEIRTEAKDVETRYTATGATGWGVLQHMRRISSFIVIYGQVLDTLSQHHPEYVALAWGALKFVLMGVLNHEKLMTQMSQALGDIADVLPRMELHVKLYPTDRMKDSMARLYAHLLLFLRRIVKWFSRNSAGRAISAIFQPFELKHKALIDGLRTCTRAVDEEASAASKAEIRGVHVDVRQGGKRIADLDKKVDDNHRVVDGKLEEIRNEIQEMGDRIKNVQGTVGDTRTRVIDLQFNEVIQHLRPKTLPEEALRKQQALIKRGPTWLSDNQGTVQLIRRLGTWISTPASPLLILQAGPRAQATAMALAVELIGVFESSNVSIVWHLADTAQEGEAPSRTDILRSLAFQVARATPGIMSSSAASFDAARFQARHSEADWVSLLCLMLGQLPRCFLLVEAGDGTGQGEQTTELIAMLENLISRASQSQSLSYPLKVMVLVNDTDLADSIKSKETTTILTVQRPAPPPPHLRRVRTGQKARVLAWSGVKKQL